MAADDAAGSVSATLKDKDGNKACRQSMAMLLRPPEHGYYPLNCPGRRPSRENARASISSGCDPPARSDDP